MIVPMKWTAELGGDFIMGSDAEARYADDGEGPARRVTLSPFQIACHAVTNAQFGDFVRETGFTTDSERLAWSFVFANHLDEETRRRITTRPVETPWWVPVPRAYWAQPEGPGSTVLDRLDHPVVHISWNDAQAYCHWSRTHLPTEAQWEFSARGGLEGCTLPWGDELTPGGVHHCNVWQGRFPERDLAEDGFAGTCPVHAFPANDFGLSNAVGNVWEWCADWFSPDYHTTTDRIDPLFDDATGSRSLRGGSFLCHASYCDRYRVAARSANTPDSSASNIGFRVMREDNPSANCPT